MRNLYTFDTVLRYFEWAFGHTIEAHQQSNGLYEAVYGPNMNLMLQMKSHV